MVKKKFLKNKSKKKINSPKQNKKYDKIPRTLKNLDFEASLLKGSYSEIKLYIFASFAEHQLKYMCVHLEAIYGKHVNLYL